jgi:hypothetical protein
VREFIDDNGTSLEPMLMPQGKEPRFTCARNGDHLMLTFQCELCHFRNIQGKDPMAGNKKHEDLMVHIRRCNLDAFWSREKGSVSNNASEARCKRALFEVEF